jgi:hypothetical protein
VRPHSIKQQVREGRVGDIRANTTSEVEAGDKLSDTLPSGARAGGGGGELKID